MRSTGFGFIIPQKHLLGNTPHLDLSHNPKLYFLQAFINNFTALDIGCNPFLIQTYNEGFKEDVFDIDYYAWEAITWAATWNIMIGKGEPGAPTEERTIQPHTAATRTDYRELLHHKCGSSFCCGKAYRRRTDRIYGDLPRY